MSLALRITAAAASYAMDKGFAGVDQIPPQARPATISHVAGELGVAPAEVFKTLAEEWTETAGRSGAKVAGSEVAAQKSNTFGAREAGTMGGVHAQMLNLSGGDSGSLEDATAELMAALNAPKAPPSTDANRVRTGAKDVFSALGNAEPGRIHEDQPYGWQGTLRAKLDAFDAPYLAEGDEPGRYVGVDLKSMAEDDPRLDLKLYRGMNSRDPATHALGLTGKLIPQGTSSDYEGFKHYDHKDPIDSYEFSADPFIALKGAGAHGFLVQTTLRELRDQVAGSGSPVIARKTCDSEGGFFVGASISPNVRRVTHPEGSYDLAATEPPKATSEKVEKYAAYLERKVPEHGGWDAFLDANPAPAASMHKRGLRETLLQVQHFSNQVKELSPESTLPAKVEGLISERVSLQDPAAGLKFAEKMLQELQMAIAVH